MGIESVVVFEKPDREAIYLRFADESICIGDGPRIDYLDIEKIIWAARKTGADAIHPGYGFLSENPEFAAACDRSGITFIGPPSRIINVLGKQGYSAGVHPQGQHPLHSRYVRYFGR